MNFPNIESAYIDPVKLRDYCLSPEHPRGKHKARVFEATFGIRQDDFQILLDAILSNLGRGICIKSREDPFGQRFYVDIVLNICECSGSVRTAWILRSGEDFARLTSCFVQK